MDQITSSRNTSGHDMMSKCHPGGMDYFSTPTGPYHMGQVSIMNGSEQADPHSSAYSQSQSLHYGHNFPQGYNPNMPERQMTSSMMCQNQQHYNSDQFYPSQNQTQLFYPQKHQPAHSQTVQDPISPCRNQVSPASAISCRSPQYISLPPHSQSSPVPARFGSHQQVKQAPVLNGQNNQQMQSLHNHQHQPAHQIRGNPQLHRSPVPPSKSVMHNQQNSLKDNSSDGHFYSTQCSPVHNSQLANMHAAHVNSFNHRMQLPSSAQAPPGTFSMGAAESGNKINGDASSRNHSGVNMKGHTNSQNKSASFIAPNSTAHHSTTASSAIPKSRYSHNSMASDGQRFQKTSFTPSIPHRPQGSTSSVYNMHPECNSGSSSSQNTISSKPSSNKTISNSLYGASAQSDHGMSRNHNPAPTSRLAGGYVPFLECTHRSDNVNQYSPFSVAAFSESARRGGRTSEAAVRENTRAGQAGKSQKDRHPNTSPIQWYRCPENSLASSFHSDIEAMQADSYTAADETATSVGILPRTAESPAQRNSQVCSRNGSNQAVSGQKINPVSNISQAGDLSSKSGSASDGKNRRAEALAAIQIKQELVDSLSKYRAAPANGSANGQGVIKVPGNNASAHRVSDAPLTKDNSPVIKQVSSTKNTEAVIPSQSTADISPRRHSSAEADTSQHAAQGKVSSFNHRKQLPTPVHAPRGTSSVGAAESPNFVSCINTEQDTNTKTQIMIKQEKTNVTNRHTSNICYVIFHGHKLICLKSNKDAVLLLCQFVTDCFPDTNVESINGCMDQTVSINRRSLDHPEKERIMLFLKNNGYQPGDTVQTISRDDARKVYHLMLNITCCTDSTCMGDILDTEVDLDSVSSSHNKRYQLRGMKQEKKAADEKNYGKLVSSDHPLFSSIPAENDPSQDRTDAQTQPVQFLQPQLPTVHSQNPLLLTNQAQSGESCVYDDDDDTDDLILVEAIEDPYVIHWSGDAPKARGLCNTYIGQLRSYTHEGEIYLVVDDLCRAFGTTDFYDGVEKENIILYSCSQEIADYLNEMCSNFPPIQTLHHSLAKGSDLGIPITEQNYTPIHSISGKDSKGNSSLKRPFCKQEIIDDDCSLAKQIQLESSEQVSQSNRQQLLEQSSESESVDETNLHIDIGFSLDDLIDEPSYSGQSLIGTGGSNSNGQDMSPAEKEIAQAAVATKSIDKAVENNCNGVTGDPCLLVGSVVLASTETQAAQDKVHNSTGGNSLSYQVSVSDQLQEDDDGRKSLLDVPSSSSTSLDALKKICEVEGCENETFNNKLSLMESSGLVNNAARICNGTDLKKPTYTSIIRPDSLTPVSNKITTSMEDTSISTMNDYSDTCLELSLSNDGRLINTDQKAENPAHDGPPFEASATRSTCDVFSNVSSVPVPADLGSVSTVQDKANILSDLMESTVKEQDESLNNNPCSSTSCHTDFHSVKDSNQKLNSCPLTNNNDTISKVHEPNQLLASEKSEDIISPTSYGSSVNESLLVNRRPEGEHNNSKNGIAVEKVNSMNHNSEDSASETQNISTENDLTKLTCHNQNKDTGDKVHCSDARAQTASEYENQDQSCSSTHTHVQQQLTVNPLLSKKNTNIAPREKYNNILSALSQPGDIIMSRSIPSTILCPPSHRSLDDIDAQLLCSKNLSETPQFCTWKSYAKLWQEHRALQGYVELLKKNLAQEKMEREKSEKLSKYYEGVIHDVKAAFKNSADNEPMLLKK